MVRTSGKNTRRKKFEEKKIVEYPRRKKGLWEAKKEMVLQC